ncbi:MAG: hypothetical protein OES13_02670 [Acidimicrobiia bacterium]|nr:hypothetical protein [Acidimicrobiia bacterium]
MKRLFGVLCVVGLVLSACGDTSGTEVVATGPSGANTGDTATTSTDGATSTTTSGEATLADYLPMFSGPEDQAEAEAFYREQERLAQEVTATCMAEQGFEYIPFVYEEAFGDPFFDAEATEEERRAEQGFGMAYWLLFEEDFVDPASSVEYDESENPDPNWAIAEAMSDAEQEAYYYALHGEQPDESAYEEFDWENATEEEMMAFEEDMSRLWEEREWKGCYEAGYEDTFGGDDVWMSFEQEFGNMWEDIELRVQADPRIIEFQQEWTSCMSDAGFDFEDQEDMWMTLDEQFQTVVDFGDESFGFEGPEITPIMDEDGNPVENEDGSFTYTDSEGNIYTEQELNQFYDELYGPKYDEAELREFMDYEITVALADWECGDFWEFASDIRQEYENEWVAENQAALDAWKASREAQG